MLKIALDVDMVLADFESSYKEHYGKDLWDQDQRTITKNVYRLRDNKEFWENLPLIRVPDFEPSAFCTKRINSKVYTRNWLRKNGIPVKPIYQQYLQAGSKSQLIKGRCDVMIDDSLSNFIELNLNGVPCLLMDTPNNKSWGNFGRIYSLNYSEIEDVYNSFMRYIFPNFKDLYRGFRRH